MIGSCREMYGTLDTITEVVFYMLINVIIIVVASILNISIIYLIKTKSVLHRPSFFFLAALACTDFLMVCAGGTMYLTVALKGVSEDGKIETTTCFITTSFMVNNALLLCCITHDRYQCIKCSMDSRPHTTKRRVAVKIALCLISSLILSSTFYIETVYYLRTRTIGLVSVLTLACFFYIAIFYVKLSRLIRANQGNNTALKSRDSNDNSMQQRNSTLNKSILMLVAAYVVAFVTTSITAHVRNAFLRLKVPPTKAAYIATIWSMSFMFSNAVIDPLIYTYRSDAIGRELRKACRRFRRNIMPVRDRATVSPLQLRDDNENGVQRQTVETLSRG